MVVLALLLLRRVLHLLLLLPERGYCGLKHALLALTTPVAVADPAPVAVVPAAALPVP